MDRLIAGRYRLGERIGAGGSARVHRATDERLGRDVAIKLLNSAPLASADPAGRDRFLVEARTAAAFLHPNAITVFDAGDDDDDLYIVMELVEGPTLAQRLASHDGPLPFEETAATADQVLAALDAAHQQGIVHRDVKPANVLIGADGLVKLADFGIAKRFDELDAAITTNGLVLGTPRYLAPEQARGAPVGPSTDVYAMGVILFEMLAGDAPFSGDTPAELVLAHQAHRVPDLDELRVDIPRGVTVAVRRALAKDPSDRFDTAGEMRVELARAWRETLDAGTHTAFAPTRPLALVSAGTTAGGGPSTAVMPVPDTALSTAALPVDEQTSTEEPAVASFDDGGPPAGWDDPPTRPAPRRSVRPPARRVSPLVLGVGALVLVVLGLAIADATSTTMPLPGAEAAAGEIIPGLPATDDIGELLVHLERDPSIVGPAGDELVSGLRWLVSETSEANRREVAVALRRAVAVWLDEGQLEPAVAQAVDDLLVPIASSDGEAEVGPDPAAVVDEGDGGGGQGSGSSGNNGRGNGRGGR